MTTLDIEILAGNTVDMIYEAIDQERDIAPIIDSALTTAYQLGRAQAPLTEAQRAAWERNRRRGGKPGRKDKHTRHRRTKAEMEAARQETQEK